ncbi:MAG: hypothetical protein RLZZ618_597 [Pseudomonadota bacterium]|jgi:general secretion pathway protein A
MYAKFFGLKHQPFSIAPDPRYLFMSERHREALAHLRYGANGGGGFVLLTGAIGAGKTTVCRCFLDQVSKRCNVAYIFNPKLSVTELLTSVCEEFHIPLPDPVTRPAQAPLTNKDYIDALNEFLLRTHAVGLNNILIIDEAQSLSPDVLEQLRLLTNLETNERKLLQIILIGQPELRGMLAQPELEQLAQRVIARFHLEALSERETSNYIRHRLQVAGQSDVRPFDRKVRRRIHQLTHGVPRRINLLCDRALLGAYAQGRNKVTIEIVDKAAVEVFFKEELPLQQRRGFAPLVWGGGGLLAGALLVGGIAWAVQAWHRPVATVKAAAPATSASAQGLPGSAASSASSPTATPPNAAAASSPVPVAAVLPPAATPLRSEEQAWRTLAEWWKLPLAAGDACDAVARLQVLCFRNTVSMAVLRQLGRPGILTLYDQNDRPAYALLTGLTETAATVRLNGVVQNLSLPTLARTWRGEFATFWRAPPGYSRKLSTGDSGLAVDWLAVRLASVSGQPLPNAPQTFDAALTARVQAFQKARGLRDDGVAGAVTLMLLNRATGVDEPRLTNGS